MKAVIDILQELQPNFDFAHSEDFFSDGYLDSFDLTRLIVQLEEEYHIAIKGNDIAAENFQSVKALQQLLKKYGIEE